MTTPPSQKDYGTGGDRALVPGTLRVFRSFMVDSASGQITPMNYHPRTAPARQQQPYPLADGSPYEATCTKSPVMRAIQGGPTDDHKSPDVDCTCGFYASYDPATDFYPSFRWGRNYTSLAGMSVFEDYYAVRAVCEVSGTVVMGRSGVRAERMKIVAFAVDWDKYMKSPAARLVEDEEIVVDSFTEALWPTRRVEYYHDDDTSAVHASAPAVADAYGVALYGSVGELYEAYPAEDVSHLVDATPRPKPEFSFPTTLSSGGFSAGSPITVQQAALYASAAMGVGQFRTALMDAVPSLSAAVRSAGKAMAGITADFVIMDEATTVKERALRLKKNRPAPPGTGIDRRRGKLR